MLKTSQLLTITVPRPLYRRIRQEAGRRKTTTSGLLRDSFLYFVQGSGSVYSNDELQAILRRDELTPSLRKDLDRRLRV